MHVEAPGSGPQRTDEASVRGHVRESLVRVNTLPMLRLADGMPGSAADLVAAAAQFVSDLKLAASVL